MVAAKTHGAGRVGLPPIGGVQYRAFADPSAGAQDSFTIAVAHGEDRNSTQVAVLDYLAERRPPFSPDQVVAEYAQVLKSYSVRKVQADKYAGQWVVEAFQRHGITCEHRAEPKATIYANALPLLNSGRAELLDQPKLAAQLLSLERRTARGGRDTIDHPPSGHDDLANAVAGALVAAAGAAEPAMFEAGRAGARHDARPPGVARGRRCQVSAATEDGTGEKVGGEELASAAR